MYDKSNMCRWLDVIRDRSVPTSYLQTIYKCMIPDDSQLPKHVGSVISKYILKVYFVAVSYIKCLILL
jgi:hypothetical protein